MSAYVQPFNVRPKARSGDVLKNIPFFSCMNKNELAEIEKLLVSKRICKNQVVLFEEDTPNFMYVVYSGKVRAVHQSEDGKERILAIHKRGDFFGEMGLLDGKTAPASVIAMEDTVIGLLAKQDFEKLMLKNNNVLLNIITMLCARFRESLLMLKAMSFANAEQRLREVLNSMARLYGIKEQRGVMISLKLTHKQIADYASVSRETATRLLGKLTSEGEIEILTNKNILVKTNFFNKLQCL
ncbi:Crp/Fnr family transcriptional regulator [Geobacter sp. AOG1]|uniref:Crp/Fnr family transcriptional regulator n=1 Tax=Geobacter sp. AOG1 TaxID=1566346 RepID=UPI001CC637E1|nr:Crp/Fnr family transcriptional regulator [Geobacter sp. AOG1]GFE58389.1 CarD family transcriptional regulator [Geobacter sp. AOG1]